MVIIMPYYLQHVHFVRQQSNSINSSQITTNILCRFIFSSVLLTITYCLFRMAWKNDGSRIVAVILLTISIISFISTYQKLRQYYIAIDSRRRMLRRLDEQQEAHVYMQSNSDLPSYKQLYPSHADLSLDVLPSPPSYDDYMKNLIQVTYV